MASSKHEYPAKTFRPEPTEYATAQATLGGRTVDGFIRACLRCLRDQPAEILALLEPYWPPKKRIGRPRKTT